MVAYIETWLYDFNDSINVKTKLTANQIMETASEIHAQYMSLSIPDLTYFFNQLKNGKYTEKGFFESMDRSKIMMALDRFFDERCETAAILSESENRHFNPNTEKMHPKVARAMFEGVGVVKHGHTRKGGGIGSRTKNIIQVSVAQNIIEKTNSELFLYLISQGPKSETHIPETYEMVKMEFDGRYNALARSPKPTLQERASAFIDEYVCDMDRQVLEDTITDWQKDLITKPYVYLLKKKRKTIKK